MIPLLGAGLLMLSGLATAETDPPFTVESLTFYGNTRSRTTVIQRDLQVRSGQVATVTQLLKDRAWMLRQRLFQRVELELLPGSADSLRHVVMIVQEKGTLSATPLIRRDSRFGLSGGVEMTMENPWGRRQRIQTAVQLGGEPFAALSWSMPQASGPARLGWRIDLRHDRTPYSYPDATQPFDRERTTLSLTLSRRLHRALTVAYSGGWAQLQVSKNGLTLTGQRRETLWQNSATLVFDTRDWPIYPRTGLFLSANLNAMQGPGHSALFWTHLEGTVHRPLFGENILAIQAVLQHADRALPRAYKRHLGGGQSVRGLRSGERAGDHVFHATVEYRIPMVYARHPLAGLHAGYAFVLFADAGTAWDHGSAITSSDWVKSIGLGVHAIWDQYVLRAEYGYRGTGWGFLSAGTSVRF